MNQERIKSIDFRGVRVDIVNYGLVREIIAAVLSENRKGYICVNDVCNVVSATEDQALFEALNGSLVSLPDGMPLAWFGKLAGYGAIERITGMDMMIKLFSENGYSHFLLGDTTTTINRVMDKARSENGGISITGYSPPFKEFDDEDNRLMLERLNAARPDIVWVSFGGGKQEKWMHEQIGRLHRGVMIGVGAAFKWYLGDLVVPPKIIQQMGLQWVFRFVQTTLDKKTRDLKRVKRVLIQKCRFALDFPGEVMKARKRYGQSMP